MFSKTFGCILDIPKYKIFKLIMCSNDGTFFTEDSYPSNYLYLNNENKIINLMSFTQKPLKLKVDITDIFTITDNINPNIMLTEFVDSKRQDLINYNSNNKSNLDNKLYCAMSLYHCDIIKYSTSEDMFYSYDNTYNVWRIIYMIEKFNTNNYMVKMFEL